MKKISDLYEIRYKATWGTNDKGEHVIVNEQYQVPRQIKTISQELRIVHFITDHVLINVLGIVIESIFQTEIVSILLFFISYFLYYIMFEYFFQQTPGKMLTKSIVIDDSAQKPDLRSIMLRTIIRLVPFEIFSCMGKHSRGWHDEWSKTYVITKENYEVLLAELEGRDYHKADEN